MKTYDDWFRDRRAWAKVMASRDFIQAVQDDAWNSALEVAAMQCEATASATDDTKKCARRIRHLRRKEGA